MENTKQKRIEELVAILVPAAHAYYKNSKEIMSNYEYDSLYSELEKLEEETGYILPNSPTQKVEEEELENDGLEKVRHEVPALSLSKTKDITEFPKVFSARNAKSVIMWKEDGCTLVATYDNGKLTRLATRGNGEVGEDITHNAPFIHGLMLNIPLSGHVIIRGEALMSYNDFEIINATLSVEEQYKNPRNLASATVRAQKGKNMFDRPIWFHAFKLVSFQNEKSATRSFIKELEMMEQAGFCVVEHEVCSPENLIEQMNEFSKRVAEYEFPVDGLVVASDDVSYAEAQPIKTKYPDKLVGFAFKWEDETVTTTLRKIEWSASRTGLLNPVAVFDPVELEGTTVSRASVHNVSIIKQMKLRVGDKISVFKANKIIPQIAKNETPGTNLTYDESHPVNCPCCGTETQPIISNGNVEVSICPNPNCPAKHVGKYTHFAERDCMNIVGISSATIEKFVSLGWIKEYADIYHLDSHKNEIIEMEGFGEKSYKNMIDAIEKSRTTTFIPFIHALGIPNIGKGQAKLLAIAYKNDVTEFLEDIYIRKDFTWIEGIGSILNDNLICWGNEYLRWMPFEDTIDTINCNKEIYRLLQELTIETPEIKESGEKLAGLTFVITGDVHHFKNRDELKEEIEKNGGKTSGSISKKTSYLINNDINSTSGKNKKAKELGVKIISEDDFLQMLA